MTIIVETNPSTFKRIDSGEITFIVHKFNKPIKLSDSLLFQEVQEDGDHSGNEMAFRITQIETDGCKSGFSAVAFEQKEA